MEEGKLKHAIVSNLKRGKTNALPGRILAQRLGFKNDRQIRLAIRELIADGKPIASSVRPPLGYFIADSGEEAIEYMKVLKSRLVNDAYRRRDFKLAARNILDPYQLGLL